MSEETEINRKCGILYGAVNNLKSNFKHVGFRNLMVLFNSYCCSVYDSQAWHLEDKNIEKIFVAWNKSVRNLCNLSNRTHVNILPFVSNTLHIKHLTIIGENDN